MTKILHFDLSIVMNHPRDGDKTGAYSAIESREHQIDYVCRQMFPMQKPTLIIDTATQNGRDLTRVAWTLVLEEHSLSEDTKSAEDFLKFFFNMGYCEFLRCNPELKPTISVDAIKEWEDDLDIAA